MKIKVVFISNYLTIHQIAVCHEFLSHPNITFIFVSSFGPSSEKSIYKNFEKEEFVIKAYHSKAERIKAIEVIKNADVIMFGSGDRTLIRDKHKLIFFYSEHPSKTKISFLRKLHLRWMYKKYINSYMLCASCYTANDFNSIGLFNDRCFMYGYFPLLMHFPREKRNDNVVRLLWVGRELEWKHPEYAFYAAKILFENYINFEIKVVSTSNAQIGDLISKNKDEPWFSKMNFIPFMSNEDLQFLMSKSDIFILSSDKKEGWGAVVNEAMNAGCCPIVSASAGCSRYLIVDGENGIIFKDEHDFKSKLLDIISKKRYKTIAERAAETIQNTWNERVAVSNLCKVFELVLSNKELPAELINNGPGTRIL